MGTSYKVPVATEFEWQQAVITKSLTTPPTVPAPTKGQRYLIYGTGAGGWAGQTSQIAVYNGASWDYTTPKEGSRVFVKDEYRCYTYSGGAWASDNGLTERIYVGPKGNFATLKEAVDWFNANATSNMEILLDAGNHSIADTVTVDNATKKLQIRGLGSGVTQLNAAAGLAGKPMFNFKSNCDINKITATGSTLALYGTLANENFITFDTTASIYSEITDIIISTFKIGIADLIGVEAFLFNFVLDNCDIGYQVNYSTAAINTGTDIEVGNFTDCLVGVDLLKATADKFYLAHLIFNQSNASDVAIQYTGGAGNYVYEAPSNIFNCTFNNVGEFLSGFDFTIARDADIQVIANTGEEDKTPHAKINVRDNATGTTATAANTFYKAAFTNGITYACKVGLADGKMTFLPNYITDGMMWVNGNLQVDKNGRNIDVAIRRSLSVNTVVGNGATVTVTTTQDHEMQTGDRVQMLGWSNAAHNGLFTITVTGDTTFTYAAATAAASNGGTAGNIISPMTVRAVTSGVAYSFGLCAYIDGMQRNDDYEIYVASGNAGDVITIQDLTWLLNTR